MSNGICRYWREIEGKEQCSLMGLECSCTANFDECSLPQHCRCIDRAGDCDYCLMYDTEKAERDEE